MLRDLKLAVRSLSATPIVTAFALLSLALTIGANSAVFSILNGLLLRPLPVHDPTRLVHITDSVVTETGETRIRAWSYPFWAEIRRRPQLFEAATAWSFTQFNLSSRGETRFVGGLWADGGFFRALGVPVVTGRAFSESDDQPGGGPDGAVTVISHGYWQREFGGTAEAIGRSVRLNSVPFTIVGVAAPGFFGPEVGRTFDFIAPLRTEALIRGGDSALESSSTNFLTVIARLRPDQSLDAAATALRSHQREIREATLEPWRKDVLDRYLTSPFTVVPAATGSSNLRRAYQRPMLIIAAIVAAVMLIGCVNLANLLLARAVARRHELSVQVALGASRWRVARQLLIESLLLSAVGAAAGLVVASSASALLVRQLSTPVNTVFLDVSIDGVVLAFTAGMTALTTLLFGTMPAIRAARVSPIDALKEHGRAATEHGRRGLAGSFVIVQVALSLALVAAAGSFIRSLASLTSRELGFQPEQVLIVTIDPERTGIEPGQRVSMYERVQSAVRRLPNVANAAVSHRTPVGGGGFTPPVEISAPTSDRGQAVSQLVPADRDVFGNLVSPGWFSVFGTPIVAGRDFTDSDRKGAPRVAVVNETFARRFLGERGVLGSSVTIYPNTPRAQSAQIVGVVSDAVYGSPREVVPPTWYLPITQFDVAEFPFSPVRLSVRPRTGSPAVLTRSVAEAAAEVNPDLVLTFRPLADQVRGSLTQQRLLAQIAGFFGGIGLLLAGIGLYGLASYAVTRRQNEIGIRMALGAAPAAVLRVVLTRTAAFVAVGIAGGIGISLWASQFTDRLIYGLPPRDPAMLAGAALILLAAGILATWLPARRAVRLDPVAALRGR